MGSHMHVVYLLSLKSITANLAKVEVAKKNCSSSDDHLRLAPKEHPKKAPKVFGANLYFVKTTQDGIFFKSSPF